MGLGARMRGAVVVALVAAALAAAGVATAAPHAHAARSTAVGIGAREYRFAVYRASVPAGSVRFNVTNYGEDGHDLVVLDRRGQALASSGEVRSGAQASVAVRLAPGTYRLRCDLADHARRGMHTTIRVTRR
jgi:plastocyanin